MKKNIDDEGEQSLSINVRESMIDSQKQRSESSVKLLELEITKKFTECQAAKKRNLREMVALIIINIILAALMGFEAIYVDDDNLDSWEDLDNEWKAIIGITVLVLEFFYISLVIISANIMCRVGYLLKMHIPG